MNPCFHSAALPCSIILAICVSLSARGDSDEALGSTFYDWDTLPSVPSKTGSVRQVLDSPTPTLRRLVLHISTLNPGPEVPHHHHPQEEVSLIKEGSVRYWINGRIYDADAGSMIFLSADAVHTPYNVGAKPAVYYVVEVYTDSTPGAPGRPADDWAAPGELHSGLFKCDLAPAKATASGSRREIVSSPTATLARLESALVTLNPGADSGILTDPVDQLIFLKSGLVEIRINRVTGRLGPGSFCFKAGPDEHRIKNIGPSAAIYQVLKFVTVRTPPARRS